MLCYSVRQPAALRQCTPVRCFAIAFASALLCDIVRQCCCEVFVYSSSRTKDKYSPLLLLRERVGQFVFGERIQCNIFISFEKVLASVSLTVLASAGVRELAFSR